MYSMYVPAKVERERKKENAFLRGGGGGGGGGRAGKDEEEGGRRWEEGGKEKPRSRSPSLSSSSFSLSLSLSFFLSQAALCVCVCECVADPARSGVAVGSKRMGMEKEREKGGRQLGIGAEKMLRPPFSLSLSVCVCVHSCLCLCWLAWLGAWLAPELSGEEEEMWHSDAKRERERERIFTSLAKQGEREQKSLVFSLNR